MRRMTCHLIKPHEGLTKQAGTRHLGARMHSEFAAFKTTPRSGRPRFDPKAGCNLFKAQRSTAPLDFSVSRELPVRPSRRMSRPIHETSGLAARS